MSISLHPGLQRHTTQYIGHLGQNLSKTIMVEVYSNSLVRTIGKVLPV